MQTADIRNGPSRAGDLDLLDRYWRAANYLSVGQIYLLDNPLLREPLQPKHIKPRLLGHWGTTPGLNFIYAHLNRAIRASDLNVIYINSNSATINWTTDQPSTAKVNYGTTTNYVPSGTPAAPTQTVALASGETILLVTAA